MSRIDDKRLPQKTIVDGQNAPGTIIEGDVIVTGDFIGRDKVDNRRWSVFSDYKQVLLVVTAIGLASVIVLAYRWWQIQPRKLQGQFNVAVAEFVEHSSTSTPQYTAVVSSTLFSALMRTYPANDESHGVDLLQHRFTEVHDAFEAAQFARKTNAHLVLFGRVDSLGDKVAITVNYFVNESLRPDISELQGAHQLTVVVPTSQLLDEGKEGYPLSAHTVFFTNFLSALNSYFQGDLVAAKANVHAALGEADFNTEGIEVLYILLVKIAFQEGDYDAIEKNINLALNANATYGRAYIALGNLEADRKNWILSYNYFDHARTLDDQPPQALIVPKANFGIGRYYFVQFVNRKLLADTSEQTLHFLAQQAQYFDALVIEAQNNAPEEMDRNGYLRFMAGWAHARTGKILELLGDKSAGEHFIKAKKLVTDKEIDEFIAARIDAL